MCIRPCLAYCLTLIHPQKVVQPPIQSRRKMAAAKVATASPKKATASPKKAASASPKKAASASPKKASKKKDVKKATTDAPKVKRAPTPYFNFLAAKRADVKKAHPDWKVTEITVEVAKQWNKLSDAEKSKFKSPSA